MKNFMGNLYRHNQCQWCGTTKNNITSKKCTKICLGQNKEKFSSEPNLDGNEIILTQHTDENELTKCSKKFLIANLNIFNEFANGYILVPIWWKMYISRWNIFEPINIKFVLEMLDINNKIHEIGLLNHCSFPCPLIRTFHR